MRQGTLAAIKTLGEVLHIGPLEVGRRGASQEMPRWNTRRGVSRIAALGEVARIAGYRDLVRSRGAAARRSKPPEPHTLAHKMRGE
jgi:hypothetical protein